jgi:Cdc6-like AAA superfamily ATPase
MSKMKSWDDKSELKVIRVNSILSNSEAKILLKLCESLSLKQFSSAFHSLEMMNYIKEYFDNNPNMSVCFILEDIDYYVETTKQVLLYKILDMFGYLKVKFVFIATSVKIDIADSFEKRIKSRFSHRMILFYE